MKERSILDGYYRSGGPLYTGWLTDVLYCLSGAIRKDEKGFRSRTGTFRIVTPWGYHLQVDMLENELPTEVIFAYQCYGKHIFDVVTDKK